MHTHILLLIAILCIQNSEAHILLEKPHALTVKQIEEIAQNWTTHFTWNHGPSWVKRLTSCSFSYEDARAGFVLRILGIPWYCQNYRFIPSFAEIQQILHSSPYYYAQPLRYQNVLPKEITPDEIYTIFSTRRCIFYTGAGISMVGNVASMSELEKSLHLSNGVGKFVQHAWNHPEDLRQAFAHFCHKAIYAEPTPAHYALKELAEKASVAIITENVDLLQHRTGIKPFFAGSQELFALSSKQWRDIDAIFCVGVSYDDRGLLAHYKNCNPQGLLIAIDLKVPNFLSPADYVCLGDAQEIVPHLSGKL